MSPPFIPPKGGKGQKNTGGSCCICSKRWLSGYLGKDCLERGNVELSYLLYLIFSYLMICGGSKAK
jgi:hypothetical protein